MVEVQTKAGRVLVVEDQEEVASIVVRWLEREGYECDVAGSLPAATALTERHSYGILFVDVHIPGGSGLALAGSLKAQDPAMQVIIMTGSTTLETAIEALRLNADDYLVKPFDAAALIHATRRASEHRRLILENREHSRSLEDRVRQQAERLEGLYLSSVHSLVGALEAKDPHTHGHSERVADFALILAEHFPSVSRKSLRIGAWLHDIGKIGITGEVLRKNGPLDSEETLHIQTHPTIGVRILSPLLDDRIALDIVRHHHEQWNGAGYPDGLAGEDIPLAARIVCVADAFDAMTTSRPYRAALTTNQAVAEIRREAGRQFDPRVAEHAAAAFNRRMDHSGSLELSRSLELSLAMKRVS